MLRVAEIISREIDWPLLDRQRLKLAEVLGDMDGEDVDGHQEALNGILDLLDALTDGAEAEGLLAREDEA